MIVTKDLQAVIGAIAILLAATNGMSADTSAVAPDTADYRIGSVSALLKIHQDENLDRLQPWNRPLRIELAGNEYEGNQLVIQAKSLPLEKVEVTVGSLVDKATNARLDGDRISISLVGYVESRSLHDKKEPLGQWPDPLLPLKPFTVEAGKNQPIWITVHAPEGTAPGTYDGTVAVKPGNGPQRTLPISVVVWNFSVPRENHLQTMFYYWKHGESRETVHKNWEFMARYRLADVTSGWVGHGRTAIPDRDGFRAVEEDLAWCLDKLKMPLTTIYDAPADLGDDAHAAAFARQMGEYTKSLAARGWAPKTFYAKLEDEPQPQRLPLVKKQAEFIRRIDPRLKTICTVTTGPKGMDDPLIDAIDIWIPTTQFYDHDLAERLRAKGKDVWWYVCGGPAKPYANYFVYYPAMDCRILFWMNWKYHVKGLLYWGITAWGDGTSVNVRGKDGKFWPEIPWNCDDSRSGDGYLVYPNPTRDGTFLSSIRLELIRDSAEDYEYHWLLNDLTDKLDRKDPAKYVRLIARNRELLRVPESAVKGLREYTQDPNILLEARRSLAEQIEISDAELAVRPRASRTCGLSTLIGQ